MINKKKININKISKGFIVILFILASLLRILYIHKIGVDEYQYDVGAKKLNHSNEAYEKIYEQNRDYLKEYRHLDYIMTIYNTGKLPSKNLVQLYHPPLHHLICAGWLKILDFFPLSAMSKIESLQILTCIYSLIALFIILKICDELKLKDFYKIIVLLFVGFNPLFIYMSGFISNDMLVSMLILLCFYLLLKWEKQPSYVNTILLGLAFGLGCATKTSMFVMLLIISGVVCFKWVKSISIGLAEYIITKKKDYKPTYKTKTFLIQILLFLLISTPIALIHPYRNYKMFNQPFLYVVPPSDRLVISDYNFINRYTPFSKELLTKTIEGTDKNIFAYAIKSDILFMLSVEFHYSILLTYIIILLYLLSIFASIYLAIKGNNLKINILIISCYIWLSSFIFFNTRLPASCTMHSKYIYAYIGLLPILNACFLQKKNSYVLSMVVYALSTLFAVFSTFGMCMLLF